MLGYLRRAIRFEYWVKSLFPLFIAVFCAQLLLSLIWSIYAPFLRGLGFSGMYYGIIASASTLSSLIGSIIGGFLADYWSPRKTLILCSIGEGRGYALIFPGSFEWIFSGSIISGFFGGTCWVSVSAIVAKTVGDADLDKGYSYITATQFFG
jgi:MFS family permease